jgi:hypothetical protein
MAANPWTTFRAGNPSVSAGNSGFPPPPINVLYSL